MDGIELGLNVGEVEDVVHIEVVADVAIDDLEYLSSGEIHLGGTLDDDVGYRDLEFSAEIDMFNQKFQVG